MLQFGSKHVCIFKHCLQMTLFLLWIGTYCISCVVQQTSGVKDLSSLVRYDDSSLAAIRHVQSIIPPVRPRPNIRFHSVLFLRASNRPLVDKMNYIEFTVLKAFTSEFKLRTNPVRLSGAESITSHDPMAPPSYTQLRRFTLWHNGCRATQLGRFTLWHNGRRATQLRRFTL